MTDKEKIEYLEKMVDKMDADLAVFMDDTNKEINDIWSVLNRIMDALK